MIRSMVALLHVNFPIGMPILVLLLFVCPRSAHAQNNYEIQVYPSETMAPKTLLTELHSNYTVEGSTTTQYGMLPTQGQEHETIELQSLVKAIGLP